MSKAIHLTIQTAAVLLMGSLLWGCGGNRSSGSSHRFLLPADSGRASRDYALSEVTIETLANPFVLDGPVAQIYFRPRQIGRGGISDQIARPRLALSRGIYVPLDAESAALVAVYSHFEQLYRFDQKLGWAKQLSWPRQVAVDLNARTVDGDVRNNAFYDPISDMIAIAPYEAKDLPLAFNRSILAHEHFHAHFKRFWNHSEISIASVSYVELANRHILEAWNEGLADFYAGEVTGRPSGYEASFGDASSDRRLDGRVIRILNGEVYFQRLGCQGRRGCILAKEGEKYALGTRIARIFAQWERLLPAAHQGQHRVLKAVFQALPKLLASFQQVLDSRITDPSELILAVASLPGTLNAPICSLLESAISAESLGALNERCRAAKDASGGVSR